ncbi:hypothetical protein [Vibrio sp. 99-70-13A1]|uniref:hypothetical protein n=1 Tax=Vibrio sp. 99-70-13A1 TaxID=2607601 RepID=UPI001493DD89|nr:hypothetical protein [Vibrio sp. 99-70-13A1]NOH98124.1 hypothetical protein [Vibrio sp. 99-70-13A1]
MNAFIDVAQGDLDMSKSIKYVVDATASTSTLSRAGYLTRFSPLGIAYSGLDVAVQQFKGYEIRYGDRAGQEVNGWSALFYSGLDNQKEIGPTPPPSQWHLQGYLNNQKNQ